MPEGPGSTAKNVSEGKVSQPVLWDPHNCPVAARVPREEETCRAIGRKGEGQQGGGKNSGNVRKPREKHRRGLSFRPADAVLRSAVARGGTGSGRMAQGGEQEKKTD